MSAHTPDELPAGEYEVLSLPYDHKQYVLRGTLLRRVPGELDLYFVRTWCGLKVVSGSLLRKLDTSKVPL